MAEFGQGVGLLIAAIGFVSTIIWIFVNMTDSGDKSSEN